MILFIALAVILLILMIVTIFISGVIGLVTLFVFGDLIVFMIILGWIFKKIFF